MVYIYYDIYIYIILYIYTLYYIYSKLLEVIDDLLVVFPIGTGT